MTRDDETSAKSVIASRPILRGYPADNGKLIEALLRHSSELVNILDAGGHIVYCSPSITVLLGYTTGDLLGRKPVDFVHPQDAATLMETFFALQGTPGLVLSMCVRLRHKNGSWRWMEGFGQNLIDDPAVRGIVSNSHDVTERVALEDAVRERERKFRALVESVDDMVLLIGASGKVAYASPAVERNIEIPADGNWRESILRVIHHEDSLNAREAVRSVMSGTPVSVTVSVRYRSRLDGWRWVSATITNSLADPLLSGVVVRARDVTDERRLLARLQESQRMESVGRLAGGVAHDFNNLMTVISYYSDSLLEESEGRAREELEEIRRASDRAISVTRQLLAFSRQQVLRPVIAQLNSIVDDAVSLLNQALPQNVSVATHLDPHVGSVRIDRTQLIEVVVALATHAANAMPHGGVVDVTTENKEVSATLASEHEGLVPGRYVSLSIADKGPGMTRETIAKLFEPFFSPPGRARGSGIGISALYGIIKQSGGYIIASSPGGVGAVFTLLLPALSEHDTSSVATGRDTPPIERNPVILLAEDDEGVRRVMYKTLESSGYRVVEAADGKEALGLLERLDGRVDFLMTDAIMPEMGGTELVRRVHERWPDIPVAFVSGHGDDAVDAHGELPPGANFLRKPFVPSELMDCVRTALHSRKA